MTAVMIGASPLIRFTRRLGCEVDAGQCQQSVKQLDTQRPSEGFMFTRD